MTIRLNPRWLLVSVLAFSLQFCRAQSIPPSLSFNLGPEVAPETQLWDLTGQYNINLDVEGRNGLSMPVQISFFLIQDASGKLSNPADSTGGLVFNNDDNSSFVVTTKIAGKVTGSGGFAHAHFTVHFQGNGFFGGIQNVTVTGSFNVDADTDPSTGELVATKITHFEANMPGVNNVKGTADFVTGLPSGVNGSWNLSLNVAGLSKFTGVGSVNMPTQSFGVDLNGKFKGGLINLKATGATDVPNTSSGKGSSAKILLTPSFDTLQVDGKLLGQKISFNVTTSSD